MTWIDEGCNARGVGARLSVVIDHVGALRIGIKSEGVEKKSDLDAM